jgi:hypothetical protein
MKFKLSLFVLALAGLAALLSTRVQASTVASPAKAAEVPSGNGAIYLPLVRNCQPLFFDDFIDSSGGWPVDDSGNVAYQYLNKEYRILITGLNWWGAAHQGVVFTDYLLSADVRRMNTNDGRAGLIFEIASDWSSFYTFEIDHEGNYVLWRYTGGWSPLTFGFSALIETGTQSNTLAVERNGSTINLFANGDLIDSFTDGTLQGSRYAGVIAVNFDQGSQDVRFDDFTVLPIGCGLSQGAPASANSESSEPAGDAPVRRIDMELDRP